MKSLQRIVRFTSIIMLLLVLITGNCLAEFGFSENADAVELAADSVFMLEVYDSLNQKIGVGSGFVAFDSMTLVTNYHVIEGGTYILAVSDDYKQYILDKVCAYDKNKDIALLRFEQSPDVPALKLDGDSELKRSQPVVAIGSPAGLMNTISLGNISAFYKKDGKDWIQFTAPISSGSSGGALFDDKGQVIGITTATYASTQNINMAVKAKYVVSLYQEWDGKKVVSMNHVTGMPATNIAAALNEQKNEEDMGKVYVTSSGKKYHNTPYCSKMRNPIELDLLDAIESGYTPCGKCYK